MIKILCIGMPDRRSPAIVDGVFYGDICGGFYGDLGVPADCGLSDWVSYGFPLMVPDGDPYG
eukprot:7936065-Pyramimonas_sp.AAC.1